MERYYKVFAALDGGKTQAEVLDRAIRLAEANKAELLLGHVIDAVPDAMTGTDYRNLAQIVKERIEKELSEQIEAARERGRISKISVEVQVGHVQETLTNEIIKPFDPDVVVCGERGLSNIKYVFVGSVSTYLIRNLRCDVLVVKED
ncbi:MAG: universal stress protein [Anaerotardibacter sp.]